MAKKDHPLTAKRQFELDLIEKIVNRAVHLYADHDIRVERLDVLMDLTSVHFGAQKLRLVELLAADEFNFMHDIGGINRNLNRETGELENCFSPRFSMSSVPA